MVLPRRDPGYGGIWDMKIPWDMEGAVGCVIFLNFRYPQGSSDFLLAGSSLHLTETNPSAPHAHGPEKMLGGQDQQTGPLILVNCRDGQYLEPQSTLKIVPVFIFQGEQMVGKGHLGMCNIYLDPPLGGKKCRISIRQNFPPDSEKNAGDLKKHPDPRF